MLHKRVADKLRADLQPLNVHVQPVAGSMILVHRHARLFTVHVHCEQDRTAVLFDRHVVRSLGATDVDELSDFLREQFK